MTYKICTLVIGLTAILFTSCLSDGDDTMVLEKGEKNEFADGDQTVVVGTNEYADIETAPYLSIISNGLVTLPTCLLILLPLASSTRPEEMTFLKATLSNTMVAIACRVKNHPRV